MRSGNSVFRKIDDTYYVSHAKGKDSNFEIRAQFGDNFIPVTDEWLKGREKQKKNQSAARKERDDCMRSLGLVKVKGSLGGTYWE